MKKGIVIRLYPNEGQEILINKTFGCARLVYNTLLDYAKKNSVTNRFKLQKELTLLKNNEETSFLKEVDKFALQNACKNLSDAYQNFFHKRSKYPKFKSKKNSKRSYQTNMTNNNIYFNDGHIRLPKLGLIPCSNNFRDSNNKIINVTVSKSLDGKYYASIIYETEIVPLPKTNKEIGIDLGTRKLLVTNEGEMYHLPKSAFRLDKKCRLEHRRLSRSQKDSKRHEKRRIILSRTYRKRANIVNDALHKLSYKLVKENDVIYMESLAMNDLINIQDTKLKKNKMINSSLGKLRQLITYKALMYEKQVHSIDQYYPSSKTCSRCNNTYAVGDSEVFCCPYCKLEIDRDKNAAINILRYGKLTISS